MAKIERVGFVGWRGMVGSVLLQRMQAERDLDGLAPEFFSTSQVGAAPPDVGVPAPPLADAFDIALLSTQDVVVTCQGSDYTKRVLPALRQAGWRGFWIDAASAKRMDDDTVIVLDPVNRAVIERGLVDGVRNYAGGNCTVSLMLLAMHGLLQEGLVEWISTMTYQSASGAGARHVRELVLQMRHIARATDEGRDDPATSALDLDRRVSASIADDAFPIQQFGAPLAAGLIPWIDEPMADGATREEWKGYAESNKILGTNEAAGPIAIDGLCVRVGAMRCHSQALTVKLRRDVPLADIETLLADANDEVELIPNERVPTLARLSPAAVAGTLRIPVGRVRKLRMGGDYLAAFTVGDQLLWGAAEPLRRMLRILREHRGG